MATSTEVKRTEVVDVAVTSTPHMTVGDLYDYVNELAHAGVPRETLVNHVISQDTYHKFIGLRATARREIEQ